MSGINGKNQNASDGMMLRSDQFAAGHEFEVRFNQIQISFAKITNIGGRIDIENFVEGGNNGYPIIRIKPKQQAETIIFEKGVTTGNSKDAGSKFREGMLIPDMIIIIKKDGRLMKAYGIERGIVISRKFSDLDAASSSIFIEKLEFTHTGLLELRLT